MLPMFTEKDVLPVGDYPLTLNQLRESHLVTGEANPSPAWDSEWRLHLVNNLEILVKQLWTAGIDRIFIDGSFVENKDHPHDVDGYFECEMQRFVTRDLHRELNALDPHKVWTWALSSRRPDPNSTKLQLPMWHQYRVDLWPDYGNFSGILDEFGNNLTFPAAFRKSRLMHLPKGIVQIVK